jgi:Ca2+-binding EF-hand superfamily protein
MKIKTAVTEEITYNDGGGLMAVFDKLDVNHKKFLDANSIYKGLKTLNVKNITEEEIEIFIESLDDNSDKKLSYMEFANHMVDCDDGKTLDDRDHELFPLFESIRRKA